MKIDPWDPRMLWERINELEERICALEDAPRMTLVSPPSTGRRAGDERYSAWEPIGDMEHDAVDLIMEPLPRTEPERREEIQRRAQAVSRLLDAAIKRRASDQEE